MHHSRGILIGTKFILTSLLTAFCFYPSFAGVPNKLPIPKVPLKPKEIPNKPAKVELKKNSEGRFQCYVDSKEFPIRGAGGAVSPGMLEQLKVAGGNCIRTWGIGTLEDKVSDGDRLIDKAYRIGIMVVPGIWVQHERHGFNYADPKKIQEQRNHVIESVRKYKNHPAVLVWGLGNEMEGPTSANGSIPVFKELEELAKLVKKEDPNHPVMTVIAASNPGKIKNIIKYCPSIDIIGVNSYSGAAGAGEAMKAAGWTKPFAVTEFGVSGHWEVAKTKWGAPIEANSQEKARSYYATHSLVYDTNNGKELCLGTFAFLWGWKQECTATWYGMYLPTLEKLPQVDAMTKAWLGEWPENRCPKIKKLTSDASCQVIKPNQTIKALVDVKDPNGDKMNYDWMVIAESTDRRVGGEAEATPTSFPELIQKNNAPECVFKSPAKAGNYRLFVTVHDGKGGAATANFPFQVK